jgi:hypothetical protein
MARAYTRDKQGRFSSTGSTGGKSKRKPTKGKLASAKKWPSIKNAKPAGKTKVKYYPGLGWAPVI